MSERIIFYPEIVAFGGGERILLALLRHLHPRSVPPRLVSYYQSINLSTYANWPVSVRELKPPRNPFLKAYCLRRYLSRRQAEGAGTALLVGIQAALHAGMLKSKDYVLMILDTPSLLSPDANGTPSRLKASLRGLVCRPFLNRGMRRARVVIATSKYMADEIKQLYGRDAVIARQGGLTPPVRPQRPLTDPKKCIRMLSVSRLEENKRVDWIMQALARQSASPDSMGAWHLDIVGTGAQLEFLKAQAKTLGLNERVVFHGHVSDDRLEEIYARADLFVMPARQGYGLPALEALMRGLPVVIHEESGVSEILRDTPWVELIQGGPDGLPASLQRICTRIQDGEIARQPLPAFPSESDWAEQIRDLCGWY
jgi:glycosyltransferase involved in cell wall biosynthesis